MNEVKKDDNGMRDEDRKELASMLVQINRDGNGIVAYAPEQLTPAQREALRRFEIAMFPSKGDVKVDATSLADTKEPKS